MASPHVCPQCRQPLASDAPDGLCPQCLLKAATASAPTPSGDGLECDIIDIGDPVEVGKKLPQFEILQMLGRGGMGVVYQARQRQLDRMVAVKILPPVDALSADFVARFTREARALAKLNHPNIVSVFDFGEAGGLYYIVMELVDGTNLRELFETRKLTPAEALAIVPKICDALQYAHEEGIVHRDIKPENILIDRKGRVKIADFGLAKLLCREALDMTLTLSGTSLGTVRYMAPEQMDKPETVDHRADLYSLGVVIYEMLTGDVPVGRYDLPSQKAHVDVRLDEIVLHALEREPARRYQHASEVRDDVEKVTSTADIPTRKRPQAAAPIPPPAGEAEAPTGGHPFFKGSWILLPMAAIFLAQFNRWGNQALFYFAIACVVLPILSRLRWRLGEIVCAVMVALALICGAITGLRELAHGYAVPNPFGVPVTLVASVCALGTFLQHQLARPAGVRAMLPELAFTVLAACAGTLPWTMLIFPIPGWDFWQGAAFAALNFTAALFLLMLSGARWGRVRAVAMLVTGLAGFTLVMLFNVLPVHVIGSRGFLGGGPDILYQKPGLPGLYLSAVLSLLIAISGVLEVRRWLSSTTDSSSSPGPQAVRIQGLIQTGTWIAIACAILFSPSDDQPAGSPNRSASATPPPATAATADPRFHIQQDRSQLPPAPTPGRQDYAFKFSGPSDHTMNLWLEVWRDGKLEIVSSFDFLARPKIGTPLEAALQLTTMNGEVASVESKGKVRSDWTLHVGGEN
ncbi:MAG TPA: protein kinase, partial [Chthoniobacteraceae bacterium]|nr:protein kinase [Chthoniobacteraceae bacterium]